VIRNVGGYSNLYGPNEDFDLWRRIVAAGGNIALLPEVYYLYRVNSAGISSTTQDLQHRLFADLVSEIWSGPVRFKSFWRIAADNGHYKRLRSPFRDAVHRQYKNDQMLLAVEFLRRGHLRSGVHTLLGALLIDPVHASGLWKTVLKGAASRVSHRTRGR